MQVKNNSEVPIEIGHTVILPGKTAIIDDLLLRQPRALALKKSGDLIFPFPEQPVTRAPAGLVRKVTLRLTEDVKPPEIEVEVKPKRRRRR